MHCLYRIRVREDGNSTFHEDAEWMPSERCISRMRTLFAANPERDFEIVDDRGLVVASTISEGSRRQFAAGY